MSFLMGALGGTGASGAAAGGAASTAGAGTSAAAADAAGTAGASRAGTAGAAGGSALGQVGQGLASSIMGRSGGANTGPAGSQTQSSPDFISSLIGGIGKLGTNNGSSTTPTPRGPQVQPLPGQAQPGMGQQPGQQNALLQAILNAQRMGGTQNG